MAHRINDRVKESTSTTGAGSFTLAGAAIGFRPFSSALLGDTDTVWYAAVSDAEWEVGLGTKNGTSLDRTRVLASSNDGALVNFSLPPEVFGTLPAAATLPPPGRTDPAHSYFGPSGDTVAEVTGQITGDAFVVWDGTQYVLFYFQSFTGAPYIKCGYQTAPSLEGPWSTKTILPSLDGYHKFVLLVDELGAPVKMGGVYHGYAVFYNGAITSKEIYHFTCSTLTGTWSLGSKVIGKGSSGDKDEYNADTPCAVMGDDGVIRMWYMGAPSSALPTYGLAIRMLMATATTPDGPFTKNYTDVLLPETSAAWDYGWMGGSQIIKRPDGTYMMVYNAGDTRPSTAGTEPNTSAIGMAYAASLDGPWSKDPANPYMEVTGTPSDAIEQTNVWRGHLAWDHAIKRWYLFYNCGSGTEFITMARQGAYDYFFSSGGNPFNVQNMTTSKVALTNSRVNLVPGIYKVRYALNVMADDTGALPKLDVDTALRLNGTDYKQAGRDFIGSYAYENRDLILEHIVAVPARGYVDLTVQVTGGTPTGGSRARRLRVNVQRL